MTRYLGRYELGEEIGRGAMAIVHRAYDPRLQRTIAIKILRPEVASDAARRQYFLTEAHAAGRLAHAGIVTVHDVGEGDDSPFMAMELLAGPTLQEILDRSGRLPVTEVVDIGLQLAEALDYAHRRGVVHRDIKPDNIVRMHEGEGVKLTDFGIARLRETDRLAPAEQREDVIGTPNFMAPEQIRGEEIDGRADLYGLGVVMYVLLSGHLPFDRDEVLDTLTAILEEAPPPMSATDGATPPALVDMIRTLMAKDPAARYANGAELAQELRQLARELETRDQAGLRLPLHIRWPLAMAAAVGVSMILASIVVHWHQRTVMTDVVIDYGTTLAQNLATETAEDILLEDHAAIQATVADMERNRHMAYLRIGDRAGRVVASTDDGEVGADVPAPAEDAAMLADEPGGRVYRQPHGDGDRFLFVTPVSYGGQRVGELAMAVPDRPLVDALRTTQVALAALVVATVLTVLLAAYVLARRLGLPIRVLANALDQVRRGRLAYRIRLPRSDEFAMLFAAYNRMAESLQRRYPESAGEETRDDRSSPRARAAPGGDVTQRLPDAGGDD